MVLFSIYAMWALYRIINHALVMNITLISTVIILALPGRRFSILAGLLGASLFQMGRLSPCIVASTLGPHTSFVWYEYSNGLKQYFFEGTSGWRQILWHQFSQDGMLHRSGWFLQYFKHMYGGQPTPRSTFVRVNLLKGSSVAEALPSGWERIRLVCQN
jgi:hypothetical protein